MTTTAGSIGAPPIDLRAHFGDRYRVAWEADGVTRGAWAESDRPWLLELRCQHGLIYPWGATILAACTDRPRIGARLRRLPCVLTARGDVEVVITFDITHVDAVLAIVKPYRRRRLSEAERARLTERLARARQRRQELLSERQFTSAGSTQTPVDDLECQPGCEVRLADAEAVASQQRRHDRQVRG